jgi:hypothetical protein
VQNGLFMQATDKASVIIILDPGKLKDYFASVLPWDLMLVIRMDVWRFPH